jgi:hypothetical protein
MDDQIILSFEDKEESQVKPTYFFQIDVLKAIMIFLVIFDHMVSWNIKRNIGVALWERISIPVFLVILGFNMGNALRNQRNWNLRNLYSKDYFKKKFVRYVVPFLILYTVSTFIGLFMYGFDFGLMYTYQYAPDHGIINFFSLIMPFWGPGNWFIPVLLQSVLVIPLLFWGLTKSPKITLIICFIIEFAMQVLLFLLIGDITTWEELHLYSFLSESILFYLSGVGLGLWFSMGYNLKDKRNRFMWILFPLSLLFIIAYQFFNFRIRIDGTLLLRGDYHFLFIPYSAFIILLTLKYLPQNSNSKISKGISLIGKSTYHILLIQILGYGMINAWWGTHYGIDLPFNAFDLIDLAILWLIFISFGILWYKIDKIKDLTRRVLFYFNLFIVFSSILLLSFWMQGFWVPPPLIFIIVYAVIALFSYFVNKEPIDTIKLAVWTGFLVLNFSLMILEVIVFFAVPSWVFFIPGVIYILLMICFIDI